MTTFKNIVVFFPHPDDESIVGGTIIKHIQQGAEVTYVCLTLGHMGRNVGSEPYANRVTLPLIRGQELQAASDILGIHDLQKWGMHDKMVEFEDPTYWVPKIQHFLREKKADLVMTFYPGFSVHPDHDATGELVVQAVKGMLKEERPVLRLAAVIRESAAGSLGEPDIVTDVADVIEQKIRSLMEHKTQFQLMIGDFNFDNPEKIERYRTERLWTYNAE